jgi:hypothetical protein
VVLRHPVAVSLATQKWSNTSIQSLLEHWLICTERFDFDRQYLRRIFVLKYEDFVRRPQSMMDDIYRFIGLESVAFDQAVHADVNGKYLQRWRESLPKLYEEEGAQAYVEHLVEERVSRFGYSMIDLERLGPYL